LIEPCAMPSARCSGATPIRPEMSAHWRLSSSSLVGGERDKETWEELRKAWNETCPERWDFDNYRVFRQVYMRFVEKYAYQVYNEPNYELRERTPYEEYRDDWNDRITGRKEKRARRLTEAQEVHQ
jgi:hypothetical protein